MSDETWLTDRKVDASKKKFFVATEIIVFDFELFIGERIQITKTGRRVYGGIAKPMLAEFLEDSMENSHMPVLQMPNIKKLDVSE